MVIKTINDLRKKEEAKKRQKLRKNELTKPEGYKELEADIYKNNNHVLTRYFKSGED